MPKKEVVVQFSEEGVSVSACHVSGIDLIIGAYSMLKALAQAAGIAEGTEQFGMVLQVGIEALQVAAELDGVQSAVVELLKSVGLTNEVNRRYRSEDNRRD